MIWYVVIPVVAFVGWKLFVAPKLGNVQVGSGGTVRLLQALPAKSPSGNTQVIPMGTLLSVDHLDNQGTMYFRYNGVMYTSPLEQYSDKIDT